MAVLTHDDLLAKVRARVGDDTSEEAISFIEDISDTFAGLTAVDNMQKQIDDLKAENTKIDNDWRKRYMDRFMGNEGGVPPIPDPTPEPEPPEPAKLSYDDLFK